MVEGDNYEKTIKIVREQLKDMAEGNFLEEDITNAKNTIISTIKGISDEQDTEITFYLGQELAYRKTNLNEYKNIIEKIIDGLSMIDKTAEIQRNKNGEIIPDPTTKDSEIVKYTKDIKEYMNEEVLPHIPDAMEFFEENMNAKKPVIRTGAEFPFTRYFYEYQEPENSEKLEKEFLTIETSLNNKIEKLFKEV